MVWGCFYYHGRSSLLLLDNQINAKNYFEVLEGLFTFSVSEHGVDWKFKQDNAPIHIT